MENKHEPAYPIKQITFDNRSKKFVGAGLTKRELIAAMAMQGLLSNSNETDSPINMNKLADVAVIQADKLLEQLNKG